MTAKKFLILVADGVDYAEVEGWKAELQAAAIESVLVSPLSYPTVETVKEYRRGPDLTVGYCLDEVEWPEYDGVILPHGLLSTGQLKRDARVLRLLVWMHEHDRWILVSGSAVELLHGAHLIPAKLIMKSSKDILINLENRIALSEEEGEWREKYSQALPVPRIYRPTM